MPEAKEVPLVSVIIPTYNRASLVCLAIESVCNQSYANIELIVVDDGSTDDTEATIASYSKVQYFKLPHKGQATARNKGLSKAKGKYIASLDSDDIWEKDFLEKCIRKIERYELDFVFANWTQVQNEKKWLNNYLNFDLFKAKQHEFYDNWLLLDHLDLRKLYLLNCPSPSSSFVLRRDSMITKWNPELIIADDWCLLMDIIFCKPCRAAFTREALWFKKIDGKNICDGRNYLDLVKELAIHDHELLYQRFNKSFSDAERLLFQRKLAYNFAVLSYHYLKFYKQPSQSLKYLGKALNTNVPGVFSLISKSIKRRIKRIQALIF